MHYQRKVSCPVQVQMHLRDMHYMRKVSGPVQVQLAEFSVRMGTLIFKGCLGLLHLRRLSANQLLNRGLMPLQMPLQIQFEK